MTTGNWALTKPRYIITFEDIPSGSFTMGTGGTEATVVPVRDAGPEHEVFVDGFRMATTEITTAQYALYLNAALQGGLITVERAQRPMNTWDTG